jgi:hypothetical protein
MTLFYDVGITVKPSPGRVKRAPVAMPRRRRGEDVDMKGRLCSCSVDARDLPHIVARHARDLPHIVARLA